MDEKIKLSVRMELLWWVFTIILATGVIYPITKKIYAYPFLQANLMFIFVFVTFTRYVFLLKHTFIAYLQPLKVAIIFLSIPIIFYLIDQLNAFQVFMEEKGVESIASHLPLKQQLPVSKYIRNEMLLFGTGSVIVAIVLPFRMLVSFWRTKNRGTV